MTIENPRAFPKPHHAGQCPQNGMTLRDYFAGQALPIVCVLNPEWVNRNSIAVEAYRVADAMLAARTAKGE